MRIPKAAKPSDPTADERIVPFDAGSPFAALVDRHYRQLYIFALSLARNPADASDLVQETFSRWAHRGSHVTDAAKAKCWLYRTLYRAFIDLKRSSARTVSFSENAYPGVAEVPPERGRGSDGDVVLEALRNLPNEFSVPLTLHYLEDCSYREIADITGVPIGTVMSRLSRGKQKLAAQLGGRST